jgi:hypothetical protein
MTHMMERKLMDSVTADGLEVAAHAHQFSECLVYAVTSRSKLGNAETTTT